MCTWFWITIAVEDNKKGHIRPTENSILHGLAQAAYHRLKIELCWGTWSNYNWLWLRRVIQKDQSNTILVSSGWIFLKFTPFQTMSWTTINTQHISSDNTVMTVMLMHNLWSEFRFFRHLGMQVSSRMCIKDVPCLSFRHSAICFSKYGTFRHANKQSRLYHPYNIQKKIIRHFARQQRTRTLANSLSCISTST